MNFVFNALKIRIKLLWCVEVQSFSSELVFVELELAETPPHRHEAPV